MTYNHTKEKEKNVIKVCGDVYLIVEVVFLGFPVTCLAGAGLFKGAGEKFLRSLVREGRKAEVENRVFAWNAL